jgi:1,2-dihydroxy-3-keto-5-methylthiopentene dioxygenase
MAVVRIPEKQETLTDRAKITEYLAECGIEYEHWPAESSLAEDEPADKVLTAYASQIEKLKARGGYVAVDVIDVNPKTAGLEEMLAKFSREHWHSEDEVRFIVAGHGIFHIHPEGKPVVAIEVEPGDLIRVPRQTLHWFDLCRDRRIRAIRLFQDTVGWTPYYTESRMEQGFQPVCFGLSHFAHSANETA